MKPFAVAVDLGGTHIRTAAIGADAGIWAKHKEPTRVRQGKAAVLDRLVIAIERTIAHGRAEGGEPVGIGIGTAGVIQMATGVITESPNFPDWRNVPLRQELAARLPLQVWVENDANAAALGEHWVGVGRGIDHLICITLGTGVGGGIILEGKLWRGMEGTAGEVGHMSLDPAGARCSCGRAGCPKAYASATGIVRMAREAIDHHEPTGLQALADASPEGLTSALVHHAAVQGDPVARRILHEMG